MTRQALISHLVRDDGTIALEDKTHYLFRRMKRLNLLEINFVISGGSRYPKMENEMLNSENGLLFM